MPSKRIQHPISVVVFVPVDVPDLAGCDGVEFIPTANGFAPLVTDREGAAAAVDKIGAAALAEPGVGLALDMLLEAARRVQDLVPGAEVQATAWFGGTEFLEV